MLTRTIPKVTRTAAQWFDLMRNAVNSSGRQVVVRRKKQVFDIKNPPPKTEKFLSWWEENDHEIAREIRGGQWSQLKKTVVIPQ